MANSGEAQANGTPAAPAESPPGLRLREAPGGGHGGAAVGQYMKDSHYREFIDHAVMKSDNMIVDDPVAEKIEGGSTAWRELRTTAQKMAFDITAEDGWDLLGMLNMTATSQTR